MELERLERRRDNQRTRNGSAYGSSMGSFWSIRSAAHDGRVKAVATVASCLGAKLPVFELACPTISRSSCL